MNTRKKTAWTYRAKVQAGKYTYHINEGGPFAVCRAIMKFGKDPRLVEVTREPRSHKGGPTQVNPGELERCMRTMYGTLSKAEEFIAYRALEGYEPSPREAYRMYRTHQARTGRLGSGGGAP